MDKFYNSNFKLVEIRVGWFVILKNSKLIRIETFEMFELKLGKLVSKLKLKLEKFVFLKLDMCSKSKFSSSIKLQFDEI